MIHLEYYLFGFSKVEGFPSKKEFKGTLILLISDLND